MFFLLVIIIIIFIVFLIFLVLLVSNLEINIEKIQLNTIKKPMIENILIFIKLKIFNKITFFKVKIDNKKIEKMKKSKFVNTKLLRKIIYKQKIILRTKIMKIVKNLDINLEQINLKLVIGLIDTMATILSIPILSTIISIIIAKTTKELGFFSGNPNGKFGIETEKAVQKYCKANGIYSRKTIDVNLQKHMGFELID